MLLPAALCSGAHTDRGIGSAPELCREGLVGAHPGVKLSRGPGGQGKPLQDLADLQGALLGTKKQAVEYKKRVSKLKSEMYRKRRKLVGQRTFQSTRPFEWGRGARAGAVGVRKQIGPPG